VGEYGDIFTKLGFKNVQATNVTNYFVEMLNSEIIKFESMKDEFINEFSQEDYEYIINGWKDKVVRCSIGDQVWGKFYCEK
jgi:phosphoethanolamine N-methyltransferase